MMAKEPTTLTDFERELLEFILKREAPQFLKKTQDLTIASRDYTGSGCLTCFSGYHDDPDKARETAGDCVFIEASGVEGGAGALIFHNGAELDFLEVYSYGGFWPRELGDFRLVGQ
ncbi:MAG: hypothetical protein GY947_13645 [Rhodobacteraceae bacterium]|nr:hypothetical protein [Paracoccaceae bacterium]